MPFTAVAPLLECVRDGRYQDGLAFFSGLETASAEDWFFAGYCLANLNRRLEASTYFSESRSRGFEGAAAVHAYMHIAQGDAQLGRAVLETIDAAKLDSLGVMLTERARAILFHAEGLLNEAMRAVEAAWAGIVDDRGRVFLPRVAQLAALIFSEAGFDAKATRYLSLGLETLAPSRRADLLLARANTHTNAGRFQAARADLELIDLASLGPHARLMHSYFTAKLDRSNGLDEQAASGYLETIALARDQHETEFEAWANLGLAAIATASDDLHIARAFVQRARGLVEPERVKLHAHVALRHGALLARANNPDAPEALRVAADAFERLGHMREASVTHLHLAEALYRVDQPHPAREALVRAADARHALGSGVALALELRGLPMVFEHLALEPQRSYLRVILDDWRTLQPGVREISITSLGRADLLVDGVHVRLNSGLAKTVATLSYLLERGPCTLERIQAEVFSDALPAQAAAQFHLVRREVHRCVPGLMIPYDRDAHTYRVVTEGVRLAWDAQELRRALSLGGEVGVRKSLALYTGPFLPTLESEWVEETRRDLEWSVAKVGLVTLERLFQDGRHEACEPLALRLLEINPFEIEAATLLVRSVLELRGSLAAQRELDRWQGHFTRELGEVPASLRRLGGNWGSVN